ncbi:ABC transporter permease [Vibrio kyushuensis]|uniref:ABC transporter permease n=1 Tax=Vibrio TaxID=662 RepID=UPI003D0BE589
MTDQRTAPNQHLEPNPTLNKPVGSNDANVNATNKARVTHPALRLIISSTVILGLWQLAVILFDLPSFILPAPIEVFHKLIERHDVLLKHTWVTAQEILLGLLLGLSMGLFFALQMLMFEPLKRWLLPILIASQAIPVFAIAPILMLWLGYGIASKVVMAAIIIFFPVTTCCYDGLRNTPTGYLDLAKTMGASKWQLLRHIQLPAALPTLASGIRVAVVIAPIGAVVGEWVGSSEGLGYLMLQANARMIVDEMFAALFILAVLSISLYFITDKLLKKAIPWENK